MGYIKDGNDSGSEGSEGSEGKEDAAKMAGLSTLGLTERSLAGTVVNRRFIKVLLDGALDLNELERGSSNAYWDEVNCFGLLDSIMTSPDGQVTAVLSVIDEDEAGDLVAKEPNVIGGKLKVTSISSL
ncbi:hypothetical protein LCM19_08845 [Qipengyuania flava]|nr:hypothetical protein [Qipengyuania flava]